MRTVTRCEYNMPGAFFPEEDAITVATRDPQAALAKLPPSAYAFRFVTLVYLTTTTELGDEVELPPTRTDVSGWYYPDGILYDVGAVEAMGDSLRILAANMRGNGWPTVVRCRTNNWQPFEAGDQLLLTTAADGGTYPFTDE